MVTEVASVRKGKLPFNKLKKSFKQVNQHCFALTESA